MPAVHTVVLCGGKGTRLEGLDLPKPMCTVRGKSILYHVLANLPTDIEDVSILYNEALDRVQFQRHTVHTCHGLKKLDFASIPMDTRGPVETAYSGMRKLALELTTPVLFVDNDVINRFSMTDIDTDYLGLGTFHTEDRTQPSSFVTLSPDGLVTDIKEKVGISNTYCTGLYYFPSLTVFYELCDALFVTHPTKKEYFMSDLYAHALGVGQNVHTFTCSENISLGTKEEIRRNLPRVRHYPMRICFDIDNTILTNSDVHGRGTGIEPIPKMVDMIRRLHEEGHTIVLATARSMETCNSNLGRAGKRGMMSVLTKLDEFKIPYDEIYFGKPWAHLYVDDKAWNQYTNANFPEFMFNYNPSENACLPRNCSNNENSLFQRGSTLIKEGPESSLEGEIYFYKTVAGTPLQSLFPTYYGSKHTAEKSTIEMEFIQGVTPSALFRNNLMTKSILTSVYDAVCTLHRSALDDGSVVLPQDVLDNYIKKMNMRIRDGPEVYTLPRIDEVASIINKVMTDYIMGSSYATTHVIHGDPWFDNMIVTSDNEVRLLDMRGKIGTTFSLKGDKMTDYAKLYQSVLGFDFHINHETYDPEYETKCRRWLSELLPVPLDDPVLECATACVLLRTFTYFSDRSCIPAVYLSIGKMKLFSFLLDA
jgi:capsule biosynthesis phosphatase